MTAIANLPDLRPSLLLDFANSGRVDPRIQCTRASSATCFGADGKLRTVAANVPRIDYDHVTGKCLGLLVESQRSNLLTNSLALSGYAQGTNGTYSAGRIGIDGVTPSVRVVANTVGLVFLTKGVPVVAGSYTLSIYFCADTKPSNGTLLRAEEIQADGSKIVKVFNFADASVVADGKWRRYELTVTHAAAGNVQVYFAVDPNVGASIDLCAAQYEAGSKVSSYIPTAASAVTRAADALQTTLKRGEDFTVIAGVERDVFSGTFPRYFSINSGSYADELSIATAVGNFVTLVRGGDGSLTSSNVVTGADKHLRIALSYSRATGLASALANGGAASALAVLQPSGDILGIGQVAGGSDVISTRVTRIALYDRALTTTEMQRLTA